MGMLEQSRVYFETKALPSLEVEFPQLMDKLAAGLVGNGSECYGFDDALSLDHDCGVDFCLWVASADEDSIARLTQWKRRLIAQSLLGNAVVPSAFGTPRDPLSVGAFYRNLIGVVAVPQDLRQWVVAPEENLSLATNGAVFFDHAGDFTAIRQGLLRYVPEDLRRKRIAAWCMQAAQAGQYNLGRMWKRGDVVAVQLCKAKFAEAAIALVFLLNRTYRPYYKWAYRMMMTLSLLGRQVGGELTVLAGAGMHGKDTFDSHVSAVEKTCMLIASELRCQGLSDTDDPFLVAHALQVQESIGDARLAQLPAQTML